MKDAVQVIALDDSRTALAILRQSMAPEWNFQGTSEVEEFGGYLASATADRVVVLLDVNMPTIDGDRVARVLVGRRPPEMSFLFFSSNEEAELQELVRRCGIDGYIPKRSSPQEIRQAVSRAAERIAKPTLLVFGRRLLENPTLASSDSFECIEASRSTNWRGLVSDGRVRAVALDWSDESLQKIIPDLLAEVRVLANDCVGILALNADTIPPMPRLSRALPSTISHADLEHDLREFLWIAPRREARIPIRLTHQGSTMLGFTRDISTSGFLAVLQRSVALGDHVECSFDVGRSRLNLHASVVRQHFQDSEPNAYGMRFESPRREDIVALREFVLRYWAGQIVGLAAVP